MFGLFLSKGYFNLIVAFWCAGLAIFDASKHAWGVVVLDVVLAIVNYIVFALVYGAYERRNSR